MKPFVKRLALVFATGYILLFFSELAFWASYDPVGMAPPQFLLTWLRYCASGDT